LAAQNDNVSLLRTLMALCFKARKLLPRVGRLLVIAREQDDQIARVLHRLVHRLHETGTQRNIVVLNENLVALVREHIGNLARHGSYRTATAQEKVITVSVITRHSP